MTNARTARAVREQKAAEMRLQAARSQRRRRSAAIAGTVIAVLILAVGIGVLVQTARSSSAAAGGTPRNLTDGAIMVGKPSAKVTLTLYEDFQCPVCQEFETESGKQIATWVKNGTVKVAYRPVAFLNRESTTQYSTRALDAAAAVVDSDPGAFQAFHDLLYAQQPPEGSAGLTDAALVQLAGQAGVPTAAVQQALKDKQFEGWVTRVTDQASKDGVVGTPTILVNGQKLSSFGLPEMQAAVQAALKGGTSTSTPSPSGSVSPSTP